MPPEQPTIHDVARLAQVSTASVSRVLSGSRPVTPEVRKRVESAAASLNYHVNPTGRSLRVQQTGTIGLVVGNIANPFFPMLVRAVDAAARTAGLGLLIADAHEDPGLERQCVQALVWRKIDALLISPCHRFLSQEIVRRASRVVNVVQIDRSALPTVDVVTVDQRAAVRLVVQHLMESGRQNLVFVGSAPSVSTSWQRQEAFVEIIRQMNPVAEPRVLSGDFSVEWGRRAGAEILSRWPETDGVVCGDDLIALGVLQQLMEAGRSVPGEIAVTGFDDSIIAEASHPALTSVRQPLDLIAETALRLAAKPSGGDRAPQEILLDAVLVPRASSVSTSVR